MISHYNQTVGEEKEVEISIQNWKNTDKTIYVYMLDKDRDMQKIQELPASTLGEKLKIKMPAYSVCLIESK